MTQISSQRIWTKCNNTTPSQYTCNDIVHLESEEGSNKLTLLTDSDTRLRRSGFTPTQGTTVYIVSSVEFDAPRLSRKTLIIPRQKENGTYNEYAECAKTANQLNDSIVACLDQATDGWLHETFASGSPGALLIKQAAIVDTLTGDHEEYGQVQPLMVSRNDFSDIEASLANGEETA